MIIKLSPASPLSRETTLQVVKHGDTLTINGVSFDFSPLESGSELPAEAVACDPVFRPVYRAGGQLVVTLALPCWPDSIEAARFPVDLHSPADGAVHLPGLDLEQPQQPAVNGVIDWSQMVTQAMKDQAAAEQRIVQVAAEAAARRDVADDAIAPLQDAVDLEEATEVEVAELKAWKKYRIALNRLPDQPGYPDTIDWPAPPA